MTLGSDGNLYATVYDSTAGADYMIRIDPATNTTTLVGGGATAANGTTCNEQGQPFANWFLDTGGAFASGLSADGAGNIYGGTTFWSGGITNTPGGYYFGTCTVNVAFKPQFPGARNGAIQLFDGSGNLLGTAYIPGTGTGPQVVFAPGTQSTLPAGGGFSQPLGDAVDAAGNVYIADTLDSRIIEIPKSGSGYGTPVILPTRNLNSPSAVAIDGSGNLFIADTGNFSVEELPWNGVSYGPQIVLANETLADVTGIAVDGNGNLYFADGIDKKVFEMPGPAPHSAP